MRLTRTSGSVGAWVGDHPGLPGQLSVGGFAVELSALAAGHGSGLVPFPPNDVLPWFRVGLGLGASVLHLSRPLYAYRALIGLRHSWLSREVLAFGLLVNLAPVYVALAVILPGWFAASPGGERPCSAWLSRRAPRAWLVRCWCTTLYGGCRGARRPPRSLAKWPSGTCSSPRSPGRRCREDRCRDGLPGGNCCFATVPAVSSTPAMAG